MKRILIDERETLLPLEPLTRVCSFTEIRNGVLSPLQRLRLNYPNASIYYVHSNPLFVEAFLERNPDVKPFKGEDADIMVLPRDYTPSDLLSKIAQNIDDDLSFYKDLKKWKNKFKVKVDSFIVEGKKKQLYIHPGATIYPGVIFDLTSGPIVIDKNVTIKPFSFLEGPLYVAGHTTIDNAKIGGGTIIGNTCRIGGEIENSIVGNFSNKHHEGFLGHSILGNWVNMGAMSTTSDLKNNYGYVKLKICEHFYDTNTIKFGSIIGDHSKIGIGVMLNTGSVVDIGCNLVDKVSGYVPAFTWLTPGNDYRLDHFIENTKKIMARRNASLTQKEEQLIRNIYEQ
jgi:glucose-1-phosphate thymidylyltransferase